MMKEEAGNLFDTRYDHCVRCIPVNTNLRKDGTAVMGKGVAKQCVEFARRRGYNVQAMLGVLIAKDMRSGAMEPGVYALNCERGCNFLAVPTKVNFWDNSSIDLVIRSCQQLAETAKEHPEATYLIPRLGCGEGSLLWSFVKSKIDFLPDNVIVVFPNQNKKEN